MAEKTIHWYDTLLYGYREIRDALDAVLPQRSRLKFGAGLTATDDPTNKQTLVEASGGGGAVDFDAVKTALAAATTDVAFNSHKLTGIADGSSASHAVNLSQMTAGDTAAKDLANATGTLAVVRGGTGVGTSTGSGDNVLGTSPTIKTNLQLNNPANTFAYLLTPAAIVANRILNLPLLTGTDTLAVLALAQAFTNKTIDAALNTILNLVDANLSNSAALSWAKFAAGNVTLPAVTSYLSSVNAKCSPFTREAVNVQTTGASATLLDSFTVPTGSAAVATWTVVSMVSGLSNQAAYSVTACFKNISGTVSIVGTPIITPLCKTDATWGDPTITVSGSSAQLNVTGKTSTTIQHGAVGSVVPVVP